MTGAAAPSRSTLWAVLLLAVLPLVFGYNWVVMKRVLDHVGPFEFAALRFILGAAVLFAVLAARRQPLALPHPGPVILVGLFQYTANIGLVLWALRGGPIGRAALLNYAMPLWVVLMAWPLLKERPTRPQWMALGAASMGITLLFVSRGIQGRTHAALLALLSGICWACATVLSKHLLSRLKMDPLLLTAWQMLAGGLVLAAVALLFPGRPTQWAAPYFIFALAWEVLPATAMAWFLWNVLLKRVDASVAGIVVLSAPLVGILSAAIELREIPRGLEALGMVLIVLSLVFVGPLAVRQVRSS
ncbi:DMT family transporter [Geothrix sp. 21YS21S-2]|uniref:DMT family transporter n=1 Tax=Geothrix sp. 21YS21S-2 TaxID=3068893 RepID=UPI0027BA98B5|nr:EamA family transporter [Geothrix sp. 21YS21S-2]